MSLLLINLLLVTAASANDLTLVKKSVGEIVAKGASFEARGTGVLLKGAAGIVTNLHVVAGSVEVTFRPESRASAIKLKATKLWPDLDLVELAPAAANETFEALGMAPLTVASAAPEAGEEVFSIGYPRGFGYSISKGVVSGVRRFSELPPNYRQGWDRRPDSLWVQTDCPINPGNSGGPLVDKGGQLVGINTWGSKLDNDIYFALSGADVVKAIEGPGVSAVPEAPNGDAEGKIDLENIGRSNFLRFVSPGPRDDLPGFLEVRGPPGAKILIDGSEIGDLPPSGAGVISNLPVQLRVVVELRQPGCATQWRLAEIPDVGILKVEFVQGEALPTELEVSSVPSDCTLTIRGPSSGGLEKVGVTHKFTELPPGDYEIAAERDGVTLSAKLSLAAGSPAACTLNFLDGKVVTRITKGPTSVVIVPAGGQRGGQPRAVSSARLEVKCFGTSWLVQSRGQEAAIWNHALVARADCVRDFVQADWIPNAKFRLTLLCHHRHRDFFGFGKTDLRVVDVATATSGLFCRRLEAEIGARIAAGELNDLLEKVSEKIVGPEPVTPPRRGDAVARQSLQVVDLELQLPAEAALPAMR